MMNNFKKILLIAGIVIFLGKDVFAQISIPIMSTPFKVTSNDTNYNALKYKLPEFVCKGILFNSSLKLVKIVVLEESFAGINLRYLREDSTINKKYKELYDNLRVKFFINGEIRISNEQFYLTINATDFATGLISYQSPLKPLTDFQKIIDEACENLNYQMQSRLSGLKNAKTVAIGDFNISFSKGVFARYGNSIYAVDFPSRFLAYNLQNTKWYSVLPYTTSKENNSKNVANYPYAGSPDIVISGKVNFLKNNYCVIQPVIHFTAGDSVALLDVRDVVQNRDKLLSRALKNIQSFLDAVITGKETSFNNLPDAGFGESDYPPAFEQAIEDNNLSLAYYYAIRLSDKFRNKKSRAELMMGIVYYKQDDITPALEHITNYLKNDSLDQEANYYAGISNVQAGRYRVAKSFFDIIDVNDITCKACRDIFFQKGFCLYNEDSTRLALNEFEKQVSFDNKIRPETFAYIAFCNRNLGNWNEAEKNLLQLYASDTSNSTYREYLTDFYNEYAQSQFDSADYNKAYIYYRQSYSLAKTYGSIIGQAQSIIRLDKNENALNEVIRAGIRDRVTSQNSIYMSLAQFCRTQVDSNNKFIPRYLHTAINLLKIHEQINNDKTPSLYQVLGSTYFRLFILDSAEYFYKKVKLMEPGEPVHYFNLAELQVMQLKADSAIATLNDVYEQIHLDKPLLDDYYLGLYYFYLIESKVIKNQSYDKEKKNLNNFIDKKTKDEQLINLFSSWSFRTFYNWAIKNQNLNNVMPGVLKNLCFILQYSSDRNLPCSN